jgi:c-di-GMP-related signal transduction protein
MEAVETAEEAEVLHQLGIDYGQGFYFLEPLPGRELASSRRIGITLSEGAGRLSPIGIAPDAS